MTKEICLWCRFFKKVWPAWNKTMWASCVGLAQVSSSSQTGISKQKTQTCPGSPAESLSACASSFGILLPKPPLHRKDEGPHWRAQSATTNSCDYKQRALQENKHLPQGCSVPFLWQKDVVQPWGTAKRGLMGTTNCKIKEGGAGRAQRKTVEQLHPSAQFLLATGVGIEGKQKKYFMLIICASSRMQPQETMMALTGRQAWM